jgi:tetratricopeptide (TPR) repeat protein
MAEDLPPLGARPTLYFVNNKIDLEPMEELLRDKVCLLRQRIKSSQDGTALYRELSDLLLRAGKISAAMNILEKSLELQTEGEQPDESGRRPGSGRAFTGSPDPKSAPERISQDGKWLFDRGLDFADAYLYEDAVECFSQAMDCGHDTFDAHYCLAGVYKSLERYPEAETHCRRALEQNPRFAPAYILLGSLLKKPGRLEDSVTACKKALLIDPDCTAAYYDLACYYSLLAKREQALAAMEMAFCKGFSDFEWVLKDPDLEALRSNPEFLLMLQSYRPRNS